MNNQQNEYESIACPTWKTLGKSLVQYEDQAEAWHNAFPHSLLKVDLKACITHDGGVYDQPVKNSKIILRNDGLELSTVGADFELVQPMDIFNRYVKRFTDTGKVKLTAGGSIHKGASMWAVAKIHGADAEIVSGDAIGGYLFFFTGFDGKLRMGIWNLFQRRVCWNTLAHALSTGKAHMRKHTKNIRYAMNESVTSIETSINSFFENVNAYKTLAAKKMDRNTQEEYIGKVILTPDELEGKKELSTKKETIVRNVIDLLDTQRGLELVPAIRGTAWQAYNAVSEYITHDYGRSEDSRLHAQWFGESAKVNQKALQLALAA